MDSREPQDVFSPMEWKDGALHLLEQTLLPAQETWIRCGEPQDVADAIRRLAVRGAPAIGVAAAYGLALAIQGLEDPEEIRSRFAAAFDLLASTRPTAVNLMWALDQGKTVFERVFEASPRSAAEIVLQWAQRLQEEDVEANRRMATAGAGLFQKGDRVLTHCNAGALATAGIGTAVGVISFAHARHGLGMVWVDETRPLLQGARLTTWELLRQGIPNKLITDSSAGQLMARGLVDRIVVGADRIAANGDVANKIGTHSVAVLAHYHGVPFYVAAPVSTVDLGSASGADIPIEERDPSEVLEVLGTSIAPEGTAAANWAFDVTPADLVQAIITDQGVVDPPYLEGLKNAVESRLA